MGRRVGIYRMMLEWCWTHAGIILLEGLDPGRRPVCCHWAFFFPNACWVEVSVDGAMCVLQCEKVLLARFDELEIFTILDISWVLFCVNQRVEPGLWHRPFKIWNSRPWWTTGPLQTNCTQRMDGWMDHWMYERMIRFQRWLGSQWWDGWMGGLTHG